MLPDDHQTRVDVGLLTLRIGIGLIFVFHGLTKLVGGPIAWEKVGAAVSNFGIGSYHQVFGFSAGLIELVGGILFGLGLVFRPTCGVLAAIMVVATIHLLNQPQWSLALAFKYASHPLALLMVFCSLVCIGPGRWALDRRYQMTLTNRYQRPKRQQSTDRGAGARRSSMTTELDTDWD